MQRFLEHVTDLRLLLLVQGDQPRYRLVELHRKRVKAASAACWWGCSPLPKVWI
jgi:ATP-dependent DNA helicase DinG